MASYLLQYSGQKKLKTAYPKPVLKSLKISLNPAGAVRAEFVKVLLRYYFALPGTKKPGELFPIIPISK